MTQTLKFGKHKGKTIEEVAQTEDGLDYLAWLHRTDQEKINQPRS
jgi:hypothetical protein